MVASVHMKNKNNLRHKEDKKNIVGKVFSHSGTEIVRTYPISKHLWKIMKF